MIGNIGKYGPELISSTMSISHIVTVPTVSPPALMLQNYSMNDDKCNVGYCEWNDYLGMSAYV